MVAYAAWPGLRRVIVMYHFAIAAGVLLFSLRQRKTADLVVEDHDSISAGRFPQQTFNLRIVNVLHLLAIVKVIHGCLMVR